MKRNMKKLTALLLVLTMALTLCACGGPKTPEEVMEKAAENLGKVKSMSYVMDMEIEMAIMGQPMEMKMTMDTDAVMEPLATAAKVTMSMAGTEMQMEVYGDVVDGKAYSYAGTDSGNGEMTWIRTEAESLEAEGLNGRDSVIHYMGMIGGLTEGEEETVASVTATRYDGVITQEYFEEVLSSNEMLGDMLSSVVGGDGLSVEELTENIGEMPISIWIDKERWLPVKYELDMTAMMESLMTTVIEEALAGLGEDAEMPEDFFTMEVVSASMVIDGYDNVEAIEIPEEARNAELVEQ